MGACLGLSCTSSADTGKPLTSIKKSRGCTDFPWLALFIAWWVAAFVVLGIALGSGGDPKRLLYRTDYKGTMCSTNEEANRPLAAWLSVTYPSLYICVESCAPGTVKIALYLNQSSQFMKQCLPPKEVIATVGGFGGTTENLANGVADVLTA
eukprot:364682_1